MNLILNVRVWFPTGKVLPRTNPVPLAATPPLVAVTISKSDDVKADKGLNAFSPARISALVILCFGDGSVNVVVTFSHALTLVWSAGVWLNSTVIEYSLTDLTPPSVIWNLNVCALVSCERVPIVEGVISVIVAPVKPVGWVI